MSNTTLYALAVCPFYKYDEPAKAYYKPTISCEGIYGITTKTCFDKQSEKDAHAEQFCKSLQGCKRCEIYRLLDKKYKS